MTAFVPNKKEQTMISVMLKWRASGKSLRAIAHRLNEKGIESKTGKAWTHVTVKATLDYADLLSVQSEVYSFSSLEARPFLVEPLAYRDSS